MSEFDPSRTATSLDDLLKSSRDQFEAVVAGQKTEIGLVSASRAPVTGEDLASASMASERPVGDVTETLNARFGDSWSSEIVEHKVERGRVTVLCKLTVGDTSKMQFGSTRVNGDEGAALQKAADEALFKCAGMFNGDGADTETAVAKAPAKRPTADPIEAAPRAQGGALDPITLD